MILFQRPTYTLRTQRLKVTIHLIHSITRLLRILNFIQQFFQRIPKSSFITRHSVLFMQSKTTLILIQIASQLIRCIYNYTMKIKKMLRLMALVLLICLASIVPFPIQLTKRHNLPKNLIEQVEIKEDTENEDTLKDRF